MRADGMCLQNGAFGNSKLCRQVPSATLWVPALSPEASASRTGPPAGLIQIEWLASYFL